MTLKEMNTGKACAIFEQLDSDKYTDEEKAIEKCNRRSDNA